jgi:hypothetical protein
MGKKNKLPSRTSIRRALLESEFNPREQSPLSIVVGLNDPSYGETRAIELIHEAKLTVKDLAQYQEKLSQAISLLALAKVQHGPTENTQEKSP